MLPLLMTLTAAAEPLEPTFSASAAGSYFPLGFRINAAPGVRLPLWDKEGSVLRDGTALALECMCQFTPSYVRIGPELTFSPLAILDVGGHYVVSPYFGTFSSLIGFENATDAWTEEHLEAQAEAGKRGTGFATRWGVNATLKAKAGPIILALNGETQHWDINPDENVEGKYLYEPEVDLLIEPEDQTYATTGLLVYDLQIEEGERWLWLGVMDSFAAAPSTEVYLHRVGPVGVYNTRGGQWSYLLLLQAQHVHRVEPIFPPYLAFRVQYKMPQESE